MNKLLVFLFLIGGLSLSGALVCRAQTSADAVVYGSTPGGYCAAIGAAREGASVTLMDKQEMIITIGTTSTTGFVILDAIRFVPVPNKSITIPSKP